MKKFLLGIGVGILLTGVVGIGSAMVKQHAAARAEQEARVAAAAAAEAARAPAR